MHSKDKARWPEAWKIMLIKVLNESRGVRSLCIGLIELLKIHPCARDWKEPMDVRSHDFWRKFDDDPPL